VSVAKILQLGDPRLRTVAAPIAEPDSEASAILRRDLLDTLLSHRSRTGYGRGIAAPQLGTASRMIHIELDGSHTLMNPRITARSEASMVIWDFCFSYFSIVFPVERSVLVEVKYQDPSGREKTLEATGHMAELLQHEIDHLDGILALDRVQELRSICTFAEWEARHKDENDRIVEAALKRLPRT
jgi:peptide deformylase